MNHVACRQSTTLAPVRKWIGSSMAASSDTHWLSAAQNRPSFSEKLFVDVDGLRLCSAHSVTYTGRSADRNLLPSMQVDTMSIRDRSTYPSYIRPQIEPFVNAIFRQLADRNIDRWQTIQRDPADILHTDKSPFCCSSRAKRPNQMLHRQVADNSPISSGQHFGHCTIVIPRFWLADQLDDCGPTSKQHDRSPADKSSRSDRRKSEI